MGYETEVLRRARDRYDQAVEQHRQQRDRLRQAAFARVPEAAMLERQIQGTMAEVLGEALRQGSDPTGAIREIRDRNQRLQRRQAELLTAAGYNTAELESGPLCRYCSDTGYVGESMCTCLEAYCQEEQRRELTSLLGKGKSFDDFQLEYYPESVDPKTGISPRDQMELVYDLCVQYASHFRPERSGSMMFNGAPGLGKTFLSACIAGDVVARGYSVCYDTAIHIFSAMERQKFGGAEEEDLRVCRRVLSCDLLIMDDLGTEMPSSFIPTALYTIVNQRLLEQKAAIISTNLTMEQIGKRYSLQIASRLEGDYRILNFAGQDIRKLRSENRWMG